MRIILAGGLICASLFYAGSDTAKAEPPSSAPPIVTVIGEIHGTKEVPAWIGKRVDEFIEKGLAPNIGLELTQADIATACAAIDRKDSGGRWFDEIQDGRTSSAMANVTCRLSKLRDEGKIGLFALVNEQALQDTPRAQRYANEVLAAYGKRSVPALILVGNLHARNTPTSMVGILRENHLSVSSSTISAEGLGEAWSCTAEEGCAARTFPAKMCELPTDHGVLPVITEDASARWDNCLVFSNLSASPPLSK